MAWDFQLLVLKIGTVLAQIQELRCMQKHIHNCKTPTLLNVIIVVIELI